MSVSEINTEIKYLYREIHAKRKEITNIEQKIEELNDALYYKCDHKWVSEPRNYGCDPLEYRCSNCYLFMK